MSADVHQTAARLPDTWLLCGECGEVTHEKWWTYRKYDDEGEQSIPYLGRLLSPEGEER